MMDIVSTLATMMQEDSNVRITLNIAASLYSLSRGDGWEPALQNIFREIPEDIRSRAANALLAGDTRMFKDLCKMIAEHVEANHPDVYYTALGWGNP